MRDTSALPDARISQKLLVIISGGIKLACKYHNSENNRIYEPVGWSLSNARCQLPAVVLFSYNFINLFRNYGGFSTFICIERNYQLKYIEHSSLIPASRGGRIMMDVGNIKFSWVLSESKQWALLVLFNRSLWTVRLLRNQAMSALSKNKTGLRVLYSPSNSSSSEDRDSLRYTFQIDRWRRIFLVYWSFESSSLMQSLFQLMKRKMALKKHDRKLAFKKMDKT